MIDNLLYVSRSAGVTTEVSKGMLEHYEPKFSMGNLDSEDSGTLVRDNREDRKVESTSCGTVDFLAAFSGTETKTSTVVSAKKPECANVPRGGNADFGTISAKVQPSESSSHTTLHDLLTSSSLSTPSVSKMPENTYSVRGSSCVAGATFADEPVVKKHKVEHGIEYPCVYIKADALPRHVLVTLKSLMDADRAETRYVVYMEAQDRVSRLGSIDSRSLRTLLTSAVFESWKIAIRTDASTEYTDELRVAFCTC